MFLLLSMHKNHLICGSSFLRYLNRIYFAYKYSYLCYIQVVIFCPFWEYLLRHTRLLFHILLIPINKTEVTLIVCQARWSNTILIRNSFTQDFVLSTYKLTRYVFFAFSSTSKEKSSCCLPSGNCWFKSGGGLVINILKNIVDLLYWVVVWLRARLSCNPTDVLANWTWLKDQKPKKKQTTTTNFFFLIL